MLYPCHDMSTPLRVPGVHIPAELGSLEQAVKDGRFHVERAYRGGRHRKGCLKGAGHAVPPLFGSSPLSIPIHVLLQWRNGVTGTLSPFSTHPPMERRGARARRRAGSPKGDGPGSGSASGLRPALESLGKPVQDRNPALRRFAHPNPPSVSSVSLWCIRSFPASAGGGVRKARRRLHAPVKGKGCRKGCRSRRKVKGAGKGCRSRRSAIVRIFSLVDSHPRPIAMAERRDRHLFPA